LPEVVGDAGILVPPADSTALASAIDSLIADPAKRREYSALGRKRILDNFNWKNAARRTADVYLEAMQNRLH
jgi:glycosyltransferase involved in cell wall biosynthesis